MANLRTSNYADFSNGVRFGDTDITIDDDGLDLRYIVENGGQHISLQKPELNWQLLIPQRA
jgi:hypothetical protein